MIVNISTHLAGSSDLTFLFYVLFLFLNIAHTVKQFVMRCPIFVNSCLDHIQFIYILQAILYSLGDVCGYFGSHSSTV